MAREPQPRTSGLSVEQADAKGLVRNSLIDSAANWDSKGKQQLRKGFLQTIEAVEDNVNNGPIGQDVAELMDFYHRFLLQRRVYLPEQVNQIGGGEIGGLIMPLPFVESGAVWMVEGQVVFASTDSGDVSVVTATPLTTVAWSATLTDESDGSVLCSTGSAGLPTFPFSAGSNDRIFDYRIFLTEDNSNSIAVEFAVDTPEEGVAVKAASYQQSTLSHNSFIP